MPERPARLLTAGSAGRRKFGRRPPNPYNSGRPTAPARRGGPCLRSRRTVLFAAEPGPTPTLSVIGLLSVPALIAVNGFFVAAEFALVAVRKTRVEELVNLGRSGAKSL